MDKGKSGYFDVIVVGVGATGITAALIAADEGATVVQMEKSNGVGGIFLITGGSCAGAKARTWRDEGILEDTPERYYNDCMQEVRARTFGHPDVLRNYNQYFGVAANWLDSLGRYLREFRTQRASIYAEPWTAPRVNIPDGDLSGGKRYQQVMLAQHANRVQRGAMELHLNTALPELVGRDEDTLEVKAKKPGQSEVNVEAKAAVKRAETLDEQALELGLDPVALKQSVADYNAFVDCRKDPDFDWKNLHYQIEQAPFYGFTVLPITVKTSGGPARNDKEQVLDTEGQLFPGLYVAWEIAGYKGFETGAGNIGALAFGRCASQLACPICPRQPNVPSARRLLKSPRRHFPHS